MSNPHQPTRDFEALLCTYTGARYAVAVNSCTMALRLCFDWLHNTKGPQTIAMPRRSYVSVPCQAVQAGHTIEWLDYQWTGWYQMGHIIDAAHYLERNMMQRHSWPSPVYACISLHAQKPLGIEQGGVILHDDPEADAFFRMARFDGRREGVPVAQDTFELPVRYRHHCYLNPSTSALGVQRLYALMHHDTKYADLALLSY